ncbi:Uncharacterised protein [Mycobacteroides abscessus subsp. abscessus]|nr:Uncharacterised protein [Mycobacteroides abscessus subsp. abscessus]
MSSQPPNSACMDSRSEAVILVISGGSRNG